MKAHALMSDPDPYPQVLHFAYITPGSVDIFICIDLHSQNLVVFLQMTCKHVWERIIRRNSKWKWKWKWKL